MLEQYEPDGWITGPLEFPFGRGINLQIEVEDVQSMVQRLSNAGYPLFRPLRESWYATSDEAEEGQREFLVQDSDGYLLRFVEVLGTRHRANE
jgi:hypothetical protein